MTNRKRALKRQKLQNAEYYGMIIYCSRSPAVKPMTESNSFYHIRRLSIKYIYWPMEAFRSDLFSTMIAPINKTTSTKRAIHGDNVNPEIR